MGVNEPVYRWGDYGLKFNRMDLNCFLKHFLALPTDNPLALLHLAVENDYIFGWDSVLDS